MGKKKPIKQLREDVLKNFSPPEILKVSEWAEKYRVLSPESCARPGRWSHNETPYAVEIMDCYNDVNVKEIVMMTSSQVAKSEIINNMIGYAIDLDPGPMLMIQPSTKMAEDYSRDRIAPMIRDSLKLKEKVSDAKSRDASNTILHKSFAGGHLTLAGSNSPAQLASRPIRDLFVDELDRCAVTSEGDSVAIAEKRTITFWRRKKVKASTPLVKGLSRIERDFNRSDKRHYYVKCEKCGTEQKLIWQNVIWDKDKTVKPVKHFPETAHYECKHCHHKIYDAERYRMVRKGRWIAEDEFKGIAGFHINQIYSLWTTLKEIAEEFLKLKNSPTTLKVFVNTVLGLPFSMKGKTPEWENLFKRRENYAISTIPKGGIFLTAGADVQQDRIHVEIVAWGRNFESWSVDYVVIPGDTSGTEVWKELDKVVSKKWQHENGYSIGLSKFCIDAGYNTIFVHNWVRKYSRSKVIAVVGRDHQQSIISVPTQVDVVGGKKLNTGVRSFPVGSSVIKEELYGFLCQPMPDFEKEEGYPMGFCHFPKYDTSYFEELTAEKCIQSTNKAGYQVMVWEKERPRNEALDCRVYARAAANLVGIDRFGEEDWIHLEKQFAESILMKSEMEKEVVTERREDSFWKE